MIGKSCVICFRQRAVAIHFPPLMTQFVGLTLSKLGDLGVHILAIEELPPMHPSDGEAIEEAIAIQARRRGVRPASA